MRMSQEQLQAAVDNYKSIGMMQQSHDAACVRFVQSPALEAGREMEADPVFLDAK